MRVSPVGLTLAMFGSLSAAQSVSNLQPKQPSSVQILPLDIRGELRTEAPFRPLFGKRFCDTSGSIYLRLAAPKGTWIWSSPITKLDPSGKTKTIPIGQIPDLSDPDLIAFAIGTGGKLVEVVQGKLSTKELVMYYAAFDENGSLITKNRFDLGMKGDFFPRLIVPLPNEDFFAAGEVSISNAEKRTTTRTSIAAIFSPDAKLKSMVRKQDLKGEDHADLEMVDGNAVLGDDGKIYLFLAANPVKVEVLDQSGIVERKLTLTAPVAKTDPTFMFVSGSRFAVVWNPTTDEPENRGGIALYDAQSGELLRLYRGEYAGSPVCFEQGKTLTFMTVMKAGFFGLATADLQ